MQTERTQTGIYQITRTGIATLVCKEWIIFFYQQTLRTLLCRSSFIHTFDSSALKKEAAGSYLRAELHDVKPQKAAMLKVQVFWDFIPHTLVNSSWRFDGMCRIMNELERKQLGLDQVYWSLRWDLNLEPPEYETGLQVTQLQCFVSWL